MKSIKNDKGVAGLTVLLSVISTLFAIGLIIMIFVVMNTQLIDNDALYTADSGRIDNETINMTGGVSLSVSNLRSSACTLVYVANFSDSGAEITAANYTQTNCNFMNTSAYGDESQLIHDVNVTYTYTYLNPSGAVGVANTTATGLAGTVDWFPLFIVITAMVVLILLTVIIITSIRSSGMMGGGEQGRNDGNVGFA